MHIYQGCYLIGKLKPFVGQRKWCQSCSRVCGWHDNFCSKCGTSLIVQQYSDETELSNYNCELSDSDRHWFDHTFATRQGNSHCDIAVYDRTIEIVMFSDRYKTMTHSNGVIYNFESSYGHTYDHYNHHQQDIERLGQLNVYSRIDIVHYGTVIINTR